MTCKKNEGAAWFVMPSKTVVSTGSERKMMRVEPTAAMVAGIGNTATGMFRRVIGQLEKKGGRAVAVLCEFTHGMGVDGSASERSVHVARKPMRVWRCWTSTKLGIWNRMRA